MRECLCVCGPADGQMSARGRCRRTSLLARSRCLWAFLPMAGRSIVTARWAFGAWIEWGFGSERRRARARARAYESVPLPVATAWESCSLILTNPSPGRTVRSGRPCLGQLHDTAAVYSAYHAHENNYHKAPNAYSAARGWSAAHKSGAGSSASRMTRAAPTVYSYLAGSLT
jgi:hypothetical protein